MKTPSDMRWPNRHLAKEPVFEQRVEAELTMLQLAQDLAALRRAAGLTPAEVARTMGVTVALVERLESDRRGNVTLRNVLRYAAACGGGRVSIAVAANPAGIPLPGKVIAMAGRRRRSARPGGGVA